MICNQRIGFLLATLCLASAGCQTPQRPPSPPAPVPGAAASATEQLTAEMRNARAEQQRLDRELNQMRDDLYRTALALKQIRDRLEGWASRSTQNVARLISLEEQFRAAKIEADSAALAEINALRESLRRERAHQERLRAIIAEREKEARDLRQAMREQEAALRRVAAPAAAPPPPATTASAPPPPPAAPADIAAPEGSRAARADSPPTGSVYRMVVDAQRALKAGDLARAQQLYQAAREQDPGLASAALGLAAVAYQMDNLGDAKLFVEEVLSADPRNAQALGLRGMIRWREGALREAVRDCERGVALDPNDALLRKFYGIALNARGRTDDAIREMRRAVELDPADAEAKLNLAILLATGSEPDLAASRRAYEEALAAGAVPDEALERLLDSPQSP
jgi:Flp pilus assembly protein TadD